MARVARHYVSKLFQPQNVLPKNAEVKKDDITSRSQKLMLDLGVIRQATNGLFYLLPLGERCLKKLTDIVDQEMSVVEAQKVILPTLVSSSLWKKSGRMDSAASELFTLKDRHDKQFVLGPTHEETVTELLSSLTPISYRHLPLRLYQINSKFRDEMKPRFGLLRSKEFIMKDLYSFDVSVDKAMTTYEIVTAAYKKIFGRIGVKYVRVTGLSGLMGGSLSHEFHFPAYIGEDKLVLCENCGHGNNIECTDFENDALRQTNDSKCSNCGLPCLQYVQGIEVGHSFLLGTRYSEVMGAQVMLENGKPSFVQMGCYGLGMTRIVAAVIECLSRELEIRWPLSLAPYKVCIIPPKEGSKESKSAPDLTDIICHQLDEIPCLHGDIIVDDRIHHTIGKRFLEARRVGYPLIVILGRGVMQTEPYIEIYNCMLDQKVELQLQEAIQYVADNSKISAEQSLCEVDSSVHRLVTHS